MENLTNLVTMAYLAAGILFILSLGGLASQETARRGNLYGIIGMVLAIAAVLALAMADTPRPTTLPLMLGALALGGVVGAVLAARVAMTSMPQLVAALHSFVGLAAVLVGVSTFLHPHGEAVGVVELIEIYVDVALGAITFTGSVIAWAKLEGRMSGKPLLLPGRHLLNAAVVVGVVVIGGLFVKTSEPGAAILGLGGLEWLLVMTVLCSVLGIHLVVAIGGADMPVVVSLLNSYSGWTAAAAGFMLQNDLLIVTGALVGSSGAILSYIMCKAMNRSIWNVVFGGFGTAEVAAPSDAPAVEGEVQAIDVDGVAALLAEASSVVVVPGYGMAVAQAQHLVNEFGELMRGKGTEVRFAIHPVAGRLPGHMNVLLAEAGVPYDIVLEMDEINDDLADTSVVLVIGANDIVNPGALEDASSPIFGMPVLEVWKAGTVVVLKRGMATGYAGVGNPLFFKSNTRMLFGDAKDSMGGMVSALRS
ncbi:MAG: NAD(P) transhydrogenase subunit beta [Rickettsiales bacterium]|nr:NAD(P) transhydrogenase subunit beta [Rickettsiales bacterium]|tara:strand:- start:554 stop:1984 length:1431 start_codon:yes stop_codon:yes gene_type:complete